MRAMAEPHIARIVAERQRPLHLDRYDSYHK